MRFPCPFDRRVVKSSSVRHYFAWNCENPSSHLQIWALGYGILLYPAIAERGVPFLYSCMGLRTDTVNLYRGGHVIYFGTPSAQETIVRICLAIDSMPGANDHRGRSVLRPSTTHTAAVWPARRRWGHLAIASPHGLNLRGCLRVRAILPGVDCTLLVGEHNLQAFVLKRVVYVTQRIRRSRILAQSGPEYFLVCAQFLKQRKYVYCGGMKGHITSNQSDRVQSW